MASVADPSNKIANRETGIEIDKIALLNSGDPVPTGTGSPAYNCPVTMYFEAECPGGLDHQLVDACTGKAAPQYGASDSYSAARFMSGRRGAFSAVR